MQKDDLAPLLLAVHRLDSILTEEFEALKVQEIDKFEALQAEKINLLNDLETFDLPTADTNQTKAQQWINDPVWGQIIIAIEKCKRSHQRNELLMSKQLETIRGALSALQNQDPSSTLELYTKLGKKHSTRRSILSGDA